MRAEIETGWRKYRGTLLVIAICVVIACLYFVIDPTTSRWVPKCTVYSLTGYKCPGCGSQRMLHALLHGDLGAAWHYNAFLLCAIPFIIFGAAVEAARKRYPNLYAQVYSMPVVITVCVLIVLWTVGRNIFA